MPKSISHGISAGGLIWGMRADMPCDMNFGMYYSVYHILSS
jgi:hypothetical protein